MYLYLMLFPMMHYEIGVSQEFIVCYHLALKQVCVKPGDAQVIIK